MRSTLTRTFAAVAAGAALTLGSAGVAFADPSVPNPIDELFVDVSIGDDDEYNQEENWEFWLEELDFVGVSCTKTDYEGDGPYVFEVPDYLSDDEPWILAIVKAGADPSTEGKTNDLYWEPIPGEELEHNSGKNISHVILCSAEVDEEEPEPSESTSSTTSSSSSSTTTKPATGPVVETDLPAGGGPSGLGLLAGLGVAAAAAGLALNRRRQSAEH